jgi:drug/metabolite transporter (DMT)-like permease
MSLRRIGLPPALGLLLLSALWALGSLRGDLFPQFGADPLTHAQADAALLCVFAVMAACIAVVRHVEFPRRSAAWTSAGVGLGLFVVPAAVVAWAQGSLSTLDRVAVFSLTPVFAVVLEPHLQGNNPARGKAALGAALAAVAGILCIFPLQIPGSLRAGMALLALLAAAIGISGSQIAPPCLWPRRLPGPAVSALPRPHFSLPAIHGTGAAWPHSVWGCSSSTCRRCSCSSG